MALTGNHVPSTVLLTVPAVTPDIGSTDLSVMHGRSVPTRSLRQLLRHRRWTVSVPTRSACAATGQQPPVRHVTSMTRCSA
jgi:hypothetical protein